MNVNKYYDRWKDKFPKMDRVQQYISVLIDQLKNPYQWGKENQDESDCSGSICFALMCAGWKIRTTADQLLQKIFTEQEGDIQALFYVTRKKSMHGSRMVPAGTAVHIMGIIGDGVILNMTPPAAKIETVEAASARGAAWGYDVVQRAVSINELDRLSGKLVYGLDEELKELFSE